MAKEKKPAPSDIEDIDIFEDFEEAQAEDVPEELEGKEPEEKPGGKKAAAKEKPPAKEPKTTPPPKTPPKETTPPAKEEALRMSEDIPVQLVAVIGRTTVSVKDLMHYQMGQVIDLGRPPAETVDVVASGKLFARGELVDIDGKLGVRIVKLMK